MNTLYQKLLILCSLMWTSVIRAEDTTSFTTIAPTTVSSSSEQPTYPELILEAAKNGLRNFTLAFQECASRSAPPNQNVLFSPVNIAGVLATLLLGAKGHSKEELLNVLGVAAGKDLTDKEAQIHYTLGSLFENFTNEAAANAATKAEIAQGIFIQRGTDVKTEFKNLSQQYYKNEITYVDFINDGAVDFINGWIQNQTGNRIKEIIKPPVTSETKLILVNTLLFNGEWEYPFLNDSDWGPFFGADGTYKVKVMKNVGPAYVLYDSDRKFSVLGLPYKGGSIVMYIILPDKGEKQAHVLSQLKANDLRAIPYKCKKVDEITYEVPYMNIDEELNLKEVLRTLGVESIFDPSASNLTSIADNIFVGKAVHKVNLDVTEAGSTGAASTAAFLDTKFGDDGFIVNRPFSFFINHQSSGLISFWGTINLPVPHRRPLRV